MIQATLEEELTELPGRGKSERRAAVDAPPGYRNGYGKPRRLAMSSGTIEVRRPRVRGRSRAGCCRCSPADAGGGGSDPGVVPARAGRGRLRAGLRGLLGDGAPLSKTSVGRLRAKWTAEQEAWRRRPLGDRKVVYAWADGIYSGLERDKAALLVVVGAMSDGTKEVLAVVPGYRESTESWASVLRDLKSRGLGTPKLLVADEPRDLGRGAGGWPEAAEQRCWNHKTTGVLDRLPKREQAEAKTLLRAVAYAPSRAEAVEARDAFGARYGAAQPEAVSVLEDDWDRMTAFHDYPEEHSHLRTTNIVESPFASVRLRTTAAKRFKRVDNDRADLEAAAGGREALPEAERSPVARGCLRREEVRGRKARPRGSAEDRRLMPFTHLLVRPPNLPSRSPTTRCEPWFGS